MKDIVDVAIGEIGYREQGNNRTKYGEYTGTNGAAWCHSFVSWCAYQAGVSTSVVPKTASTTYGMQWFQKQGLFKYKGKYTPKRCDIVYFKTGRSHVGIVESVSGGQLHTIEGNTSDQVARRTYPLNNATITGYGTPKYAGTNTSGSSGGGGGKKNSKQDSKKELQYLQKVLARHETKAESIKADEKATGKLPTGNVIITVNNGKKKFTVPAEEGMKIVWERDSVPGKLTFTTKMSKKYKIDMGSKVTVIVDNINFFAGYIFTKDAKKDGMVACTAYDQLRYLKNKDTLIYSRKTADEVVRMIAKRFLLKCGTLAKTGWRRSAVEDNTTLFDMIQNALDDTLVVKGKTYVLYDDFGELRLTDVAKMKVNTCLVDAETGEDYAYKTTIDTDVYNQIKLIYKKKKSGKKKKGTAKDTTGQNAGTSYGVYMVRDNKAIAKWGTLQFTDEINSPDIGKLKAEALLKLYDKKKRTLTVSGVIGNSKVRGGSLVPVLLDLGDIKVANYMLVEKVTHIFKNHEYTMDLVLSGGGFSE